MNEMIKMVVVLTVLSSLSGGVLASLKDSTKERIENQELELVKAPAIRMILEGVSNDPVADRFKLKDGDTEKSFFVGILDGKPQEVAFEVSGKGYGDKFGLMVGVNMNDDKIIGIGLTTHKETPGLGAKAKDDPTFAAQFKGLSLTSPIKVTNDGGVINAISGATITSKAVCEAATNSGELYKRLKPELKEKIKEFTR
jgi:electron transport complex protein RnfG